MDMPAKPIDISFHVFAQKVRQLRRIILVLPAAGARRQVNQRICPPACSLQQSEQASTSSQPLGSNRTPTMGITSWGFSPLMKLLSVFQPGHSKTSPEIYIPLNKNNPFSTPRLPPFLCAAPRSSWYGAKRPLSIKLALLFCGVVMRFLVYRAPIVPGRTTCRTVRKRGRACHGHRCQSASPQGRCWCH